MSASSGGAGPGDIVLQLRGITKRFGGLLANDAIDLDLHRGEILALLGENGAGKTTLMNILFGHYVADAGDVLVAGEDGALNALPPGSPHAALAAGIGMVHQHFALADNLSVLDNIVLGTERLWSLRQDRQGARRRLESLVRDCGLEVPLGAPVATLSVGERQRVEILKALYRGARVLILDEPTAVLTPLETDQLFLVLQRLAARGLGVVFISHKLGEVMRLSRRVAVLRGGRKVWETPTRDTDRGRLAEAMVGRPVAVSRREPLPPGEPVLELEGVVVPGGHGRQGLEGVSLAVRAFETLGIAGVAGNGQQTLAALLSGLVLPSAGTVTHRGAPMPLGRPDAIVAQGVGRIPEDRHEHGIVPDMEVRENLVLESLREPAFQRRGVLRWGAIDAHALTLIRAYEVRCEGPRQRTRLLSGGNIQKLILGRVLERAPGLVLADQPTRGLDVGAVGYVHDRLLEARGRGAAVLLISEDLDELRALADRIGVMYRGRLSEPLPTGTVTLRELGLLMAGQERHAA